MASGGGWWVYPEGLTGQAFSLVSGRFTKYGIMQSRTKPSNAVAGPFATQQQAQAKADSLTSSAIPGPATPQAAIGDVASGVTGGLDDLAHRLTESQTWLRVGEVLAGLILLYVGLKSEFPTTVNTIMTPVRDTAKGTFNAAKLGLI